MIAWWWLLVGYGALVAMAAVFIREVREALLIVAGGTVAIVLGPLVWLVSTIDVGVTPLSPRALERFAGARRANRKPAWVFSVRWRGVIILRKWKPGDDRVKLVELSPQWAQKVRKGETDGHE